MAPPAQQHVPTADGALAAASSALATVEKAVAEPEAVRVTEAHYEPPPTFAMPDDDEHLGYHEEEAHSAHYPFESEYDAQRYIFCSRAYMFDAGSRYPPRPKAKLAGQEDPAELQLELPAAMPPRFRDAAAYRHAQQRSERLALPQLSDGGNATPEATSKGPVVSLLLPSAALQGVVGGGPSATPIDTDLMQVQCQVLNASRFQPPV